METRARTGEAGPAGCAVLNAGGLGPFVTRRIFLRKDGSRVVWHSRHHRKGLLAPELAALRRDETLLLRSLWMPQDLNWWIGVVFAIGSFLFGLGSVLWLLPAASARLGPNAINSVFFAGSIPFTTAAYLQLFQASNAGGISADGGERLRRPGRRFFGWEPFNIGWLSCALQFPGTLLFNVSTFAPLVAGTGWFGQDVWIWAPDFAGSVLFLASGYLAFGEVCHSFWRWEPCSLSWWVTFTNLLGCIAFMVSAIFAFVLPHPLRLNTAAISVVFTLVGALGFFAGSLLLLPESFQGRTSSPGPAEGLPGDPTGGR